MEDVPEPAGCAVPRDSELDDEFTFKDLHPEATIEIQQVLLCGLDLTLASANITILPNSATMQGSQRTEGT